MLKVASSQSLFLANGWASNGHAAMLFMPRPTTVSHDGPQLLMALGDEGEGLLAPRQDRHGQLLELPIFQQEPVDAGVDACRSRSLHRRARPKEHSFTSSSLQDSMLGISATACRACCITVAFLLPSS